ncbi:Hypothetical_protein [Hexamita inflata]|uniref:Hypothetical_protein n=1 Tax=Hexamita inflata TaxID=28002 RepID=A0AA86RYH9_9EUKA|nr:Hypothetical protein HINF_LOCUS62485 [Hexamita inflata]
MDNSVSTKVKHQDSFIQNLRQDKLLLNELLDKERTVIQKMLEQLRGKDNLLANVLKDIGDDEQDLNDLLEQKETALQQAYSNLKKTEDQLNKSNQKNEQLIEQLNKLQDESVNLALQCKKLQDANQKLLTQLYLPKSQNEVNSHHEKADNSGEQSLVFENFIENSIYQTHQSFPVQANNSLNQPISASPNVVTANPKQVDQSVFQQSFGVQNTLTQTQNSQVQIMEKSAVPEFSKTALIPSKKQIKKSQTSQVANSSDSNLKKEQSVDQSQSNSETKVKKSKSAVSEKLKEEFNLALEEIISDNMEENHDVESSLNILFKLQASQRQVIIQEIALRTKQSVLKTTNYFKEQASKQNQPYDEVDEPQPAEPVELLFQEPIKQSDLKKKRGTKKPETNKETQPENQPEANQPENKKQKQTKSKSSQTKEQKFIALVKKQLNVQKELSNKETCELIEELSQKYIFWNQMGNQCQDFGFNSKSELMEYYKKVFQQALFEDRLSKTDIDLIKIELLKHSGVKSPLKIAKEIEQELFSGRNIFIQNIVDEIEKQQQKK